MTASTRRAVGAIIAVALAVAACGEATPTGDSNRPSPEPGALKVVATTTVLADLVGQTGGTKVSVTSLIPKGGEAHTFDPTPSSMTAVADAGLIIANGLGFDDFLAQLIVDSGATAPVVRLAEGLPGATILGPPNEPNPHLWLNVGYARTYVARIAAALKQAIPGGATALDASTAAYDARLAELDAWARSQIAGLPAANRKIISLHEAFPYFAAAYGLDIVGVVVSTPGQDPSAGEIAALIDAIRLSGARAIFSEVQFSDKLARTVADETGARVESNLYNDTLGDPPVDTYEGLIRWDVERIVAALR